MIIMIPPIQQYESMGFPPTRVFEGTSEITSAEEGIIILYMPV